MACKYCEKIRKPLSDIEKFAFFEKKSYLPTQIIGCQEGVNIHKNHVSKTAIFKMDINSNFYNCLL